MLLAYILNNKYFYNRWTSLAPHTRRSLAVPSLLFHYPVKVHKQQRLPRGARNFLIAQRMHIYMSYRSIIHRRSLSQKKKKAFLSSHTFFFSRQQARNTIRTGVIISIEAALNNSIGAHTVFLLYLYMYIYGI